MSAQLLQVGLGGGSFWNLDAVFSQFKGIKIVELGYAGGTKVNPTYREICANHTGHSEMVNLMYDPKMITFENILDAFWLIHDPTQKNRQGSDRGIQYKSVVFYTTDEQKQIALKTIKKLENSGNYEKEICTKVEPLMSYFKAEDYHKNYYKENTGQMYVDFVIPSKVNAIRKKFPKLVI